MSSLFDFDDSQNAVFEAKTAGKSTIAAKYEVLEKTGEFLFLAHTDKEFALRCQMIDENIAIASHRKMSNVSDSKGKLVRALYDEWKLRHANCINCKLAKGDLKTCELCGEKSPSTEVRNVPPMGSNNMLHRGGPMAVCSSCFNGMREDGGWDDWDFDKHVASKMCVECKKNPATKKAHGYLDVCDNCDKKADTTAAKSASRRTSANDSHHFYDKVGPCATCGQTTGHRGAPNGPYEKSWKCPPGGCNGMTNTDPAFLRALHGFINSPKTAMPADFGKGYGTARTPSEWAAHPGEGAKSHTLKPGQLAKWQRRGTGKLDPDIAVVSMVHPTKNWVASDWLIGGGRSGGTILPAVDDGSNMVPMTPDEETKELARIQIDHPEFHKRIMAIRASAGGAGASEGTPAPGTSTPVCGNGHEVPNGMKFCGECGSPAAAPAAPKTTRTRSPKKTSAAGYPEGNTCESGYCTNELRYPEVRVFPIDLHGGDIHLCKDCAAKFAPEHDWDSARTASLHLALPVPYTKKYQPGEFAGLPGIASGAMKHDFKVGDLVSWRRPSPRSPLVIGRVEGIDPSSNHVMTHWIDERGNHDIAIDAAIDQPSPNNPTPTPGLLHLTPELESEVRKHPVLGPALEGLRGDSTKKAQRLL